MKETPNRVMYQKTFKGINSEKVDEEANDFREREDIRAMYTQTHVIGGVVPMFITVIFYTRKI